MKNFRHFLALSVLVLSFSSIYAQSNRQYNWQEKVMADKIAFITAELELTVEEAHSFWPVYNQIASEKKAAQKANRAAYNALKTAMENGTASDEEIDKLLNDYLAAVNFCHDSCKNNADRFRKVLPGKKVAKLYMAEEKFRRQHIRSMKCEKPGSGRPGDGRANVFPRR